MSDKNQPIQERRRLLQEVRDNKVKELLQFLLDLPFDEKQKWMDENHSKFFYQYYNELYDLDSGSLICLVISQLKTNKKFTTREDAILIQIEHFKTILRSHESNTSQDSLDAIEIVKIRKHLANMEDLLVNEYPHSKSLQNPKMNPATKLKFNGSPALFGFLITELAKKGYIEYPLRSGDPNYTGLAKICFSLFEIQTTSENLIREFNPNKNSLSETKRRKFSIPEKSDVQ